MFYQIVSIHLPISFPMVAVCENKYIHENDLHSHLERFVPGNIESAFLKAEASCSSSSTEVDGCSLRLLRTYYHDRDCHKTAAHLNASSFVRTESPLSNGWTYLATQTAQLSVKTNMQLYEKSFETPSHCPKFYMAVVIDGYRLLPFILLLKIVHTCVVVAVTVVAINFATLETEADVFHFINAVLRKARTGPKRIFLVIRDLPRQPTV
jgi:hypothetical protein